MKKVLAFSLNILIDENKEGTVVRELMKVSNEQGVLMSDESLIVVDDLTLSFTEEIREIEKQIKKGEVEKMEKEISIKWSVADILNQDPTLTELECCEILELLVDNHDANEGINWEVIDTTISMYKDDRATVMRSIKRTINNVKHTIEISEKELQAIQKAKDIQDAKDILVNYLEGEDINKLNDEKFLDEYITRLNTKLLEGNGELEIKILENMLKEIDGESQ